MQKEIGSYIFPVVIEAIHRATHMSMYVGGHTNEEHTDVTSLFKNPNHRQVIQLHSQHEIDDMLEVLSWQLGDKYAFEPISLSCHAS